MKKLRLKRNGEQVKAVLIETEQLQQWKNEISAEVLEAVKSDLNNCASHSRYFSDELDAQIFYPKENICLFLALYVLKYSYG